MNHFCTLFDSGFLPYGLALWKSLCDVGESFHLYVVCFDDTAAEVLESLALAEVTPIRLAEFESAELLSVKPTRSRGEYCWTATPHVVRYCLETFSLDEVTYLDADLFFFDSPSILLEEFRAADASVLLTEHRYTPAFDLSAQKGIYCVQFMTFKADMNGMAALTWWGDRCLEWCFDRNEAGKFGDQKYLDDWTDRFDGVHVLEHPGGGVAPWNVQRFPPRREDGRILVESVPLVFYHFHGCRRVLNHRFDLGCYPLTPHVISEVYLPYLKALLEAETLIKTVHADYVWSLPASGNPLLGLIRKMVRIIKGHYNVLDVDSSQTSSALFRS